MTTESRSAETSRKPRLPLPGRGPVKEMVCLLGLLLLGLLCASPAGASISPPTPIQHVVVVFQENHSFDNVLGKWCVQTARCDGATSALITGGVTVPLTPSPDIVPVVCHTGACQQKAIDHGRMDHFDRLCRKTLRCLTQYDPSQIPNLVDLATRFAVSDATFEDNPLPSWFTHVTIATANLDGFALLPGKGPESVAPGGCPETGSSSDVFWNSASGPELVPSCIPFPDGSGAYRPSPVPWVPTIMDDMDQHGVSYKLYQGSEFWSICANFADCIETAQDAKKVPGSLFIGDAEAGALPAVSFITPTPAQSQHNSKSMLAGDNYIGQIVNAVESGPSWASTAILITYDDCGCFYDHVSPPIGLGARVPMVIVSPYARAGYTDHSVASFASVLALIEHVFLLPPLSTNDAFAYDFSDSFDFSQTPLPAPPMRHRAIPRWERAWIVLHPIGDDPT